MTGIGGEFEEVVRIIQKLRKPGGCPWDRKQTVQSALKDLKGELEELEEAFHQGDWEEFQEELGDVLWAALFTANIAQEKGDLSISRMLKDLRKKIIRRHPHVFAQAKFGSFANHKREYEKIKQKEKQEKAQKRVKKL